MWLITVLFGIFFFYPNLSSSQYTGPMIDTQLSQINSGLMAEETKLSTQLKSLITLIASTNTILLTKNLSMSTSQQQLITSLYASLQDLSSLATDLSTLNNFWPYTNVTTCANSNQKQTEIEFSINYIFGIGNEVLANLTRLTGQYNWVAYNAFLASSTLVFNYQNGLAQQQQIAQVLTNTGNIMLEYGNYIILLTKSSASETLTNINMQLFKSQYCQCPTDFSPTGYANLSTLATNVQVIEQPLVSLESTVIAAANSALSNANAASAAISSGSFPWVSININRTVTFLNNLITTNTYYDVSWNNVSSCFDLHKRAGLISHKYRQYSKAWFASLRNTTWTLTLQLSLNTTAALYKLSIDQLTAVGALIGSLKQLQPIMGNYTSQLSFSSGKMMRVWLDMVFLDNSYCACINLPPTTTSKPTTTIKTTTVNGVTTTKTTICITTTTLSTNPASLGTSTIPLTTTTAAVSTSSSTPIVASSITTPSVSTSVILGTSTAVDATTLNTSTPSSTTTTTTITTTPSTTTTTVAPVINGCGLWARYNLDNEPINVGFSPGTARDGSTLYIGRGKSGSNYLPGRVLIGTGVYVPGGSEQLVNEPEYLVIPSGCQCVWTDPAAAMNHSGLVLTPDPNNFYAIGLVQLSSTQVAISSVVISPGSQLFNQAYNNAAGSQVTNTKATQVLVCETTTSTATPPVINFKNEACGVWSTMNYTNYVTTIGFSAGKVSLNNTVAWIGRGPFNSQFCAGRYEAAVGWSFVPWTRDNPAMASEFLIVPQGCRCYWMNPNQAWIRRSHVKVSDDNYHYAVGRMNLSNGQTTIAKVQFQFGTDFSQWYADTLTSEKLDNPSPEVLVCENIPDPPNPCDLWIQYYNDASPTINGFSAGISAYKNAANSTAYIARGFRDSWLIPGRVQISGSTGAIYVTNGNEYVINPPGQQKYGEYLVIRDSCSCKWLPPYLASNHLGLVKTGEQNTRGANYGPDDFIVTRYTYDDGRVSIGKTITPFYTSWYTNGSTTSEVTLQYPNTPKEVLVCESTSDMSTKPTLDFGNKACALWSKFKPATAYYAATHGLYAGVDRNGNDAYVGRGNYGDKIYIGRVQITGNVGVYVYGSNEVLSNTPEYLVVPKNCSCEFLPFATAITKVGLVRSIDWSYGYAVGLKNFTSGHIALSSVRTDLASNNQWYVDEKGNTVVDTATVALVCETP